LNAPPKNQWGGVTMPKSVVYTDESIAKFRARILEALDDLFKHIVEQPETPTATTQPVHRPKWLDGEDRCVTVVEEASSRLLRRCNGLLIYHELVTNGVLALRYTVCQDCGTMRHISSKW
jgi:hypothetical protein